MLYVIILLIIVFVVLGISKNKLPEISDKNSLKPLVPDSYKPTTFMSDNELEFFNRLVQAFPQHFVFPQVAMSGLVEPKTNDYKKNLELKILIIA